MYDFQYELEGGEGTRNKIVFISWSPDEGALVMVSLALSFPKSSKAILRLEDKGSEIGFQGALCRSSLTLVAIAQNDLRIIEGEPQERPHWTSNRGSGKPRRRD